MKLLVLYLILINLISLLLMYSDKERAKRGNWRISERCLFLAAILGGSIGSMLGMRLFHHKTRHWYFVMGMPVIFLIQLAAALLLLL